MGSMILLAAGEAIGSGSPMTVGLVGTLVGGVAGVWGTLRVLSQRVNDHAEKIKAVADLQAKRHTKRVKWESDYEMKHQALELKLQHEAELDRVRRSASDSTTDGATRPHTRSR